MSSRQIGIVVPVVGVDQHRRQRDLVEEHLLHAPPVVSRGRWLNRLREAAHVVPPAALVIDQREEAVAVLLVVPLQLCARGSASLSFQLKENWWPVSVISRK
jgi:hypothetical protein